MLCTSEDKEEPPSSPSQTTTITNRNNYLTFSWPYSTNCLQFDTSCFTIAKTVEALTIHYATHTPLATLYLLCSDYSAFLTVTNLCSQSAQTAALLFHHSMMSFITAHPLLRLGKSSCSTWARSVAVRNAKSQFWSDRICAIRRSLRTRHNDVLYKSLKFDKEFQSQQSMRFLRVKRLNLEFSLCQHEGLYTL